MAVSFGLYTVDVRHVSGLNHYSIVLGETGTEAAADAVVGSATA